MFYFSVFCCSSHIHKFSFKKKKEKIRHKVRGQMIKSLLLTSVKPHIFF